MSPFIRFISSTGPKAFFTSRSGPQTAPVTVTAPETGAKREIFNGKFGNGNNLYEAKNECCSDKFIINLLFHELSPIFAR